MAVLDTSNIGSAEARSFLWRFMLNREVNREFYRWCPPRSWTTAWWTPRHGIRTRPRESLLHQLYVVRNYVYAVKTGVMLWGPLRERLLMAPALATWGKRRLLAELERTEAELVELLSLPDIEARMVKVPWQDKPLPALRLLDGLNDHEILHTGWNLALMDHLQLERYPALSRLWG